MEGTSDKGYVTGNGAITEVRAEDRGKPVELDGKDLKGQPLSLADHRGKVVAINFWGDWCSECHAEAREIVEVAKGLDPDEAVFLGINTRDSPETGQSYEREFDVPFPSFHDGQTGRSWLAFNGKVPVYATPSTVVLDRKGRVAAVILGVIPSALTLSSLIEQVAAEDG
nr:TlpA disulfide reductase family protein [Nocardioides daedukensis]